MILVAVIPQPHNLRATSLSFQLIPSPITFVPPVSAMLRAHHSPVCLSICRWSSSPRASLRWRKVRLIENATWYHDCYCFLLENGVMHLFLEMDITTAITVSFSYIFQLVWLTTSMQIYAFSSTDDMLVAVILLRFQYLFVKYDYHLQYVH